MKLKTIRNFLLIFLFNLIGLFFHDMFYRGTKLGFRDQPKSLKECKENLPSLILFSLFISLFLYDIFRMMVKYGTESEKMIDSQSKEMQIIRNSISPINNCFSCGYQPSFLPWGEDGKSPSMEICPCCGVQFGNEDMTLKSLNAYRSKWISKGAKWFSKEDMPEAWDIEAQMKHIPEEFL
jgi:hypothetical protein